MTDIGSCFNPKNHPEVKSGRLSVQNLLNAFFETFSVVSKDGFVTLEQFMEYYANASFYEDDDQFEQSMIALWTAKSGPSRGGPTSLEALARAKSSAGTSDGAGSASSGQASALERLQAQLKARGARGIIGLSRKFRILDDDNSKSLSMSEFKKGIRECGLSLSELELHELFTTFDQDRSGSIDYDEFLRGVRVSRGYFE
jgi:hypothetical protein